MQTTSFIRPLLLGAAFVGTFLAVSCSNEGLVQPAPATTTASAALTYSGEELFKGIFLLEGKVAAEIPSLQSYHSTLAKAEATRPAAAQQRRQRIQQLIQQVNTLAPGFFAELQSAVVSQDFRRIETALYKGVALQQQVQVATHAGKQRAHTLDISQYDFSQTQEVARYAHDMKVLHPVRATQPIEEGDDMFFVHDLLSGTVRMVTLYPGTPNNGPVDDAVTEVMQKQASLEKDQLVRDIAFLRK